MKNKLQDLIYASLVMPISGAGMPIFVYLLPFYANELGLGLTAVGLIFFIGRFTDVLTDPIMGFLVDRYQLPNTKHKHWIAISIPVMMLATYLLFFPIKESVNSAYLFISLFIIYAGFTLVVVTHLSWSVVLAPDYDKRTNLLTLREVMSLLAALIVIAIPAVIEIYTPSMEAKVNGIGYYIFISVPVLFLISIFSIPDHSTKEIRGTFKDSVSVFKEFFKNKNLNRMVMVSLLIAFSQSLSGALFIIVITSIFDLQEYASRAMLSYFIVSFIGLGIWRYIGIKISKHMSIAYCCFYASSIILISIIGFDFFTNLGTQQKIIFLFVWVIFYGFAFAGPIPLINAIIGDLAEMHKHQKGQDVSGSIYSYVTTITKIGFAASAAIPYVLLEQVFGFQVDLGYENTQASKDYLWNMYVYVPLTCFLIAGYLVSKHPIKKSDLEAIKNV